MRPGILAVDPGQISGWAIYPRGSQKPVAWGQIKLGSAKNPTIKSALELRRVFIKAAELKISVMVIEGPYKIRIPKAKTKAHLNIGQKKGREEPGWKTYHSMGIHFGRWLQLALEARMKHYEVNPRSWQAATIGTGPREQQIPKYQDLARHITGQELSPDTAAAVTIGRYWIVKGYWQAIVEQENLGI